MCVMCDVTAPDMLVCRPGGSLEEGQRGATHTHTHTSVNVNCSFYKRNLFQTDAQPFFYSWTLNLHCTLPPRISKSTSVSSFAGKLLHVTGTVTGSTFAWRNDFNGCQCFYTRGVIILQKPAGGDWSVCKRGLIWGKKLMWHFCRQWTVDQWTSIVLSSFFYIIIIKLLLTKHHFW